MNDNSLKQAAWDVLNKNTVGVWPPVMQVGGTDVVNSVNEVSLFTANLATIMKSELLIRFQMSIRMIPPVCPYPSTQCWQSHRNWHPTLLPPP